MAEVGGERLIALLGDPAYYGRHGWEPATLHGIAAPDPPWRDYFQVRLLAAHDGARAPSATRHRSLASSRRGSEGQERATAMSVSRRVSFSGLRT